MIVTKDAPNDQYARYSADVNPASVASSLKYNGRMEHTNREYAELATSYSNQDLSNLMSATTIRMLGQI